MSGTPSRVSRNTGRRYGKEAELKEWAVVLRAVSTQATGQQILYTAEHLLLRSTASQYEEGFNAAILEMVATLLDYPTTDPASVERVLRGLPPL